MSFESPFSPPLSQSPHSLFLHPLSLPLSYRRRHRPGLIRDRVPGHDVEQDAPRGSGGAEAAMVISSFNRREEAGDAHQSPRRLRGGHRARRREGSDRNDAKEHEEASYPLHYLGKSEEGGGKGGGERERAFGYGKMISAFSPSLLSLFSHSLSLSLLSSLSRLFPVVFTGKRAQRSVSQCSLHRSRGRPFSLFSGDKAHRCCRRERERDRHK